MPLIFQHRIYRADLKANPHVLYVFGDNERRVGLGGQAAEMRGESNAVGVATLASPGRFWLESDAARQCAVIDADMAPLFDALRHGELVVFPLDGIGTGIADLERRSPTTFAHLRRRIDELKHTGEQ
jgi:hypothetical protein